MARTTIDIYCAPRRTHDDNSIAKELEELREIEELKAIWERNRADYDRDACRCKRHR